MHKQALFMLNLGHCIINKTCISTIIGMQFSNHLKQPTIKLRSEIVWQRFFAIPAFIRHFRSYIAVRKLLV